MPTADAPHQTIGKLIGLAVFASDALSSTAYATQEMLVILAAAGTLAFGYAFPISLAIVGLLLILTVSYEQIIHEYPGGGGAYIVARDNLGDYPALVAAAALLADYILTVSVSISSGVAQVISFSSARAEWESPQGIHSLPRYSASFLKKSTENHAGERRHDNHQRAVHNCFFCAHNAV